MSMRGASAEALAALRERLDAAPGDAARTGDDLFGVAAVLRSEPGLRRIATDVSTEAAAKSGLVRQLFEGKLSAEALELVADAVSRRWTAMRDLADALEELGAVAVIRSAGDQTDRLADELFSVQQTVNGNSELRSALSDSTRSQADRSALWTGLLRDKALPATIRLAEQSLSGSHRTVTVALEEYQKLAAAVAGEGVARVVVAKPLTDGDVERLQSALSRQYGRAIHLNMVVDPSLLGGIRVEIGDDVIDGSVASRLDNARRQLAG